MASHIQLLLQQKVFDVLKDDNELQGYIDGVFDHVKDNFNRPYIVIADDNFGDFSGHTFDGFEGELRIHTWAESRGHFEVKRIQNRVYELLHNYDPAITGFCTISFRCTLTEVELDPDGRTYHGIQIFSFLFGGNST